MGNLGDIKNWLGEQVALQKERLFLWSPVALGLGIGFYFTLQREPPLSCGIIGFSGALVLAALNFRHHEENARRYSLWLAAITLCFISGGFLAAQIHTRAVYTPMISKAVKFAEIEGTVDSIEALEDEAGSRIILSDLKIEDWKPDETPRTIRLKLRKDDGIAPGQRIRILAGLNPPAPPVMPGAFDFQQYSYFQNIGAIGFAYKAPEILSQPSHNSWDLFWEQTRLKLVTAIDQNMGPREAPMAIALIVGKRLAISKADDVAMRNSGLTHLISISGLHIGLVSALLFFLTRFIMALFPGFALRHPIKKYAAVVAILGAYLYTVLAAAPVPTMRSMLMTATVFLAIIFDRSPISMRIVAFAALIVLILSPDGLLSASFQMSFAAVAALIAFYEHFSPKISVLYQHAGFFKRGLLYFMGVCLTTLVAGTATQPFSLYNFQQFTSYGLLANALAVPLSSFVIMPAALFGVILMPLHLAHLPFYVMALGIDWMYEVAYRVAALPGAVLYAPQWPFSFLLLFTGSALIVMLWKGHLKVMAMPLFIAAVSSIFLISQPDILVSSDGKLKAFRGEDRTLYASTRRADKFVLENWERLVGVSVGSAQKWPREGNLAALSCDEEGCRLELKGKKIAFTDQPYAIVQDCSWADVVISDEKIEPGSCRSPVVIDALDTWRYGAHSIFIKKDGSMIVRRTNLERGQRLWVSLPVAGTQ